MTVDTYHILIGGIFIISMVLMTFFIRCTGNILLDMVVAAFISVGFARMIRRGYDFVILIDWQGIYFTIKSTFLGTCHFVMNFFLVVIIILIAFLMLRTYYYGVVSSDNKQSKEE